MLKMIREYTKAVVWFLVAAFVLWGASSLLISQNRTTSYAGEAFGRRVSYKEYHDMVNTLSIFTGSENLDQQAKDAEVWMYLVFKREAQRRKIQVADEEVKDQIRQMFGGENFDAGRYERWVKNVLQSNPRDFEEITREFIRIQKLIRSVDLKTGEVTDEEIKSKFEEEHPSGGSAAVPEGATAGGGALDEKTKDEYRKKIGLEKAKKRFTEWNAELIREARIKKY